MHSVEVASLPVPRTSQSRELDTTPQSPRHESLICNRKTLTGTHSRSWFVFLHLTLQVKLLNFKSTVPANKRTNAFYIQPAQHLPPHHPRCRRLLGNFIKVRRRGLRSNRFPFRLCFCKFYVVRKLNFIGLLPFAEAPPPSSPPPGQSDCCHRMNVRHPRTERNVHRHPEGNI